MSRAKSSGGSGNARIFVGMAVLMGAAAVLLLARGPAPTAGRASRSKEGPDVMSPERIREIQAADRDILGDLELAKPGDPSFDSVAAYLPAMKNPREAVGIPYHRHDIGIAPDGTIQLSDDVDVAGAPTAFFEVGDPAVRFGRGADGCTKSLQQGYLPIVTARFEHEGIEYRQKVFGSSEGWSTDKPLWAYVELAAKNATKQVRDVAVTLRFDPPSAANPSKTWVRKLGAGETTWIQLRIPFDLDGSSWSKVREADFFGASVNAAASWAGILDAGLKLAAPESRINDAARAWQAYAMLDVDAVNGVLEPHDGAGFYEQVYGYSAALLPHAFDLWGRPNDARRILDSLLTFQQPDGLFTSHFGTPDPGTLLGSLWEHYELTRDLAWLRGVAPRMIKMADWIIARRKESMGPAGAPRSVTDGLIKFSPYCDYQTPSFDYFGDTYCAVGLEKTAKALKAAGLAEEAGRIGREAEAYRRDILASMDAAVIERDGFKILPIEPDTHRLLKSTNYRGGGYYGLIAGCVLENEFLPADDVRAGWLMRFMKEKGGLRLGMAEFDGGVDHAYTYGYWLDCLKLDRVEEALLGLYGSLAYGMSQETYSGVEVTHLFTGANEPTLPHLYSCTQQLRLLRMMLAREDGPDLRLCQAAPRPWLEAGKTIRIEDAPTKFGPVSLTIESHVDGGRIDVRLAAPAREAPRQILLRLRHPQEKPIKRVTVDGRPFTTFSADTVTLAAPKGTLKIAVEYD